MAYSRDITAISEPSALNATPERRRAIGELSDRCQIGVAKAISG